MRMLSIAYVACLLVGVSSEARATSCPADETERWTLQIEQVERGGVSVGDLSAYDGREIHVRARYDGDVAFRIQGPSQQGAVPTYDNTYERDDG